MIFKSIQIFNSLCTTILLVLPFLDHDIFMVNRNEMIFSVLTHCIIINKENTFSSVPFVITYFCKKIVVYHGVNTAAIIIEISCFYLSSCCQNNHCNCGISIRVQWSIVVYQRKNRRWHITELRQGIGNYEDHAGKKGTCFGFPICTLYECIEFCK